MKKCHSLFATLFAATALYAGDIVEICPCDRFGYTVSATTYTYDSPAPSGEPLYFNVRLISAYQNNTPPVAAADRSHFDLEYIAIGGMGKEVDAVLNPLKIGIVVSGKTVWANLVDVRRTPSQVTGVDEACNLTDCIFEYRVAPGDFALPIRLAQDDKGTPCGIDSSGAGPVFQNQKKWSITYTEQPEKGVAKRDADLSALCASSHYTGDEDKWFVGLTEDEQTLINTFRDITLYSNGFWVRTLDIDGRTDTSSWEEPTYWKSVAKGHTVSSTVRSDGDAVLTNNNTVVWIWAVDKAWLDRVKADGTETSATWVTPAVEMTGTNKKSIPLTVGYNRSATPVTPKTETVSAACVKIVGGAIKGDFSFKGTAEGDVYLVMSGSSNFLWSVSAGCTFVKDSFVAVPVKCVKAEREVTLRRGESAETYTVTSDYETPLTTLDLTLAEDYTEAVTVKIQPSLKTPGDPAQYVWTDYIRIASEPDSYNSEGALTVTFAGGKADTKTVYVFGRGAAGEDSGLYTDIKKGNCIEFELTVNPSAAAGDPPKIVADSIYVKPADPVIANAAALSAVSVRGGVALPIDINVSDNYTDINDKATGYKVMFRAPGATEEEVVELKTKAGKTALWRPKGVNGTLYAYDKATGTYTEDRPAIPSNVETGDAELWLVAPNAAKSERASMTLTVTEPAQVKWAAYATEDGTTSTTQFKEYDSENNEEGVAYIGVTLSEAYTKADMIWAFLKLSDGTKAQYVKGDCIVNDEYTSGIPIQRDNLVGDSRGIITFKDGLKGGTALNFTVVLCTSETYDEDNLVTDYKSNNVTLKVGNVAPTVNDIRMNGWRLNAAKTSFKGSATVGIVQKFKFDIGDAELDMDSLHIAYTFTDGSTTDQELELDGDPSTWDIQRKFKTVGTDKCSLEYTITDKDGGKVTGSVSIDVSANPYVAIMGDATAFYEGTYPQWTLSLSAPADEDLTVRLTVTARSTGDKRGKLEVTGGTYVSEGVYDFTFKENETAKVFSVSESDGTSASVFEFSAKVTTDTVKPGTADTKWCDFYTAGGLSPITVNNVVPSITVDGRVCTEDTALNSSNSPINVAIGEADSITWSVDDVKADLDRGIKVTIVDQYGAHKDTYTTTDDQTFTPQFKYAGATTVSFTATDKDGGSITATRYYLVKSTRQLNITAVGPSENGNGSTHAGYYRGAGRGQGHVYADAKCTGASNFSFDFNCGLATYVKASAQGYRKGDVDNGTLTKNGSLGDNAITPDGKLWTAGDYFTYDGGYDSFFYCWVKDTYDNGVMTSAIFGVPSPEVSQAGNISIDLPTEKDDEESYAQTIFEAVFSKEYLTTDNIGDINNDAIPDIYALGYEGFGVSGEDQTDMTNLGQFNDDEDYFPFVFSDNQGASIFKPAEDWVANSKKFTARLEIRGWGDHLNNAWQVLSAQGYAGSIPEYTADVDRTNTYSAVEYDAWVQAGKDPNWSPERPTDPTKADTDGDEMPDGFEYYTWYKAHVGWITDSGEHKYLTGRKYNPANPYDPIEISSATIAAAFDPLTNAGSDWDVRDTDDDGLTDYAEFVLGTSAFDYDTDKDGLPDSYETLITGTDPLMNDTNKNGTSDGAENPDNDSMAEISETMFFTSVIGANGTEYYCCAGAGLDDYTTEVATNILKGTTFEVVTGGGSTTNTLVTTRAMAGNIYTNDADQVCLGMGFNKKNTWQCSKIGGKWVRTAEPTDSQVKLATVIQNITEDAEYHDQHLVAAGDVPVGTWYVAYPYQDGYARGAGASFETIAAKGAMTRAQSSIKLLHYQVYQKKGFHSSTGWIHPPSGGVDTRSYTSMDEFLSMVFFHKTGSLSAADLQVTDDHSRLWIWQHYSTSPVNADTDGDQMPDGWEFYLMAKEGDAGPGSVYSPIYDFRLISVAQTRDNDQDLLEWPHEYSGTSSSSRYGWSPLKPAWRNKAEPTDPWDDDTDEDGIKDGHEGGYDTSGAGISGVVSANFMYNSSGTSGGGLNPLTWDTDSDGLPDPWEVEFHGTYKPGSATTQTTQTTTIGEDGTTNTTETTTTVYTGCEWNMDGMNATVTDAHVDYDHDGLVNWQEYLVGTMRCWRYDDPESGWTSHTTDEEELMEILDSYGDTSKTNEWNKYWGERLADVANVHSNYNPHFANGYFDAGAPYFSCCRKPFDPCQGDYYYLADGIYHDQKDSLRWYEKAFDEFGLVMPYSQIYPMHYISCDPRNSDTDFDGMDDYYELFHGMNPLLGAPGVGYNGREPCDIVFDAYNRTFYGAYASFSGNVSALNNWWLNDVTPHETGMGTGIKHSEVGGYDFVAYPWLNGIAAADPDGDNIVNQEEAIMPNVQAASTYHHTDPTPLWMTDSSYTNSLTRRYYRVSAPQGENDISYWYSDGFGAEAPTFEWEGKTYKLSDFPGITFSYDALTGGSLTFEYDLDTHFHSYGWYYSFEENEGYDSDHDYLSDYEEGQAKTKNASDPQVHDDPLRRQAMYFNGVDAFLETPVATTEWDPDPGDSSTEARQNFLYYTVECWAKPDAESLANDNNLRTLVERAIWADNASAADETLMRKNFLIGVKNGRWYTCFDSSGTDIQPVEINNGPVATTNWTHVAATYDGTALRLYVNGICNNAHATSIQPEHGVAALALNKAGEMNPKGGTLGHATDENGEDFVAILVGASAKTKKGIVFDSAWRYRNYLYADAENPQGLYTNATTFADYHNFYKGYVDEVRIWDGARSAADIQSDVDNRVRYTLDLAAENRQAVYNNWTIGGLRSPAAETQLPPQLMYHWAFDQIAGAVLPEDVIKVPAGFNTAKSVLNAKARWSRPADFTSFGWESSAVRSKVYTDTAWVPWINNTVAHLPRFDLTTLDSVYWSEDYAGAASSVSNGYSAFQFPRNAEVYSRWTQRTYGGAIEYYCIFLDPDFELLNGVNPPRGVSLAYTSALTDQRSRWDVVSGYGSNHITPSTKEYSAIQTDLAKTFRFALRDRNTCGDDILPMGGAYPRRISIAEGGMWDNQPGQSPSASDAWAQTGNDADNNGLPDWWEEYARANYCETLDPKTPLEWDTTVKYRNGMEMPAYQAYLRDLSSGLVKIGNKITRDANYADTRDGDKDGLPDWWEEMYGLDTSVENGDDDPDNDGLSNYHEYLLGEYYIAQFSEQFEAKGIDTTLVYLNPTLAFSHPNQVVPDYFWKYTTKFDEFKTGSQSHFFANEYFGEIATDHDFMEDWWENLYDSSYTSAKKYDPSFDKDGDGWSTWAECRAALWGNSFTASLIDKWTGADSSQYVPCRPQPIIGVRATYYGNQDISGKQLVVRTTSGQRTRTDATFVIPSTLDGQTKFLGGFSADTTMHGHLNPGLINANTIAFDRARTSSDKTYVWNCDWYVTNTPDAAGWEKGTEGWYRWNECSTKHVGSFDKYKEELAKWPQIKLDSTTSDFNWESFVTTVPSADLSYATLIIDGVTAFGRVDCVTGEYTLDMSKFSGEGTVDEYVFRVTYSSRIGHEWPQTVYLSDTRELSGGTGDGYVREGKNTIEAFIDLNADGAFTEGEPYGVVQNVDVGWHKVPVTVIELKDTSHVVPRVSVASGEATSGQTKKLTIRRVAINGQASATTAAGVAVSVPKRTLATKTLVLDSRSYLSEADVLGNAKFDLDSRWLVRDAEDKLGMSRSEITDATYEILEVQTLADGSTSNVVLKTFTNTFNPQRTTPAAISPVDSAPVYASAPTFAFSCSDETMTAYRLQIRRADDKAKVYDSGITLLPGRVPNTAGVAVYEVTPPVYAGARVCSGAVTGEVFADSTNYQWRVSLFNAKFNEIKDNDDWSVSDEGWSVPADFQMDVANNNRYPKQATGYGSASASVRYYGPTNAAANQVWVEAFENADFRGQPAARATLGSVELLGDYENTTKTNALMSGLAPNTYYFRAFIDFNNNGQRDDWESWGYLNYVGKGVKAIYNPKPFTVTASTADWIASGDADFTIYIEDCDTDQNEIPDCMEEAFYKGSSGTATDSDGDGIADSEEEAYGTDPALWDTDNDGMPDGYEAIFAETDPTLSDAEECVSGDVMAFAKIAARFVTVDSKVYLLPTDAALPNVGDSAKGLEVYTTYTYPIWEDGTVVEYLGVGTNLTLTAEAKIQAVSEDGTAVLVHAQVYDAFGYDPTTATTMDEAANTKEFTALDKYLVVRYLEAIGLADEATANKRGLWEQCTLKPYNTDFDADGIADGWELYVMFGPKGAGKTGVTQSPWNYDDRSGDADGDGLAAIDEYDGGYWPTDSWNGDTFAYGIGDKAVYDYNLKGEDAYRIDDDNDQLANFIEYLISSMPDFPTLDAGKMATGDGQLVPDYFLRHGSLYLGEMFADHDFIEDWWEDEQPTELERGGTRLANYSRFVYDANRDSDSDGWNNWEECRATFGGGWTNIVAVVTNGTAVVTNVTRLSLYEQAGGRPIPEVPIAVAYNGTRGALNGKTIVVKAWCQENVFDPEMHGEPDAAWVFTADDTNPLAMATNLTAATTGYLRSGKNMFVAYVADGAADSGTGETATVPAYVPGQPYGVALDVAVNYLKATPFTVEMTDVNAAMARINLTAAAAAQVSAAASGFAEFTDEDDLQAVQSEYAAWIAYPTNKISDRVRTYASALSNCFNAVSACYDRGANATTYTDLSCPDTVSTNMTFFASNVYVRIYRSQVNGMGRINTSLGGEKIIYSFASEDPVWDSTLNLMTHPYLTEADLLAAGDADLDWGTLRGAFDNAPIAGMDAASIESATYRVVLGTGTGSCWTNNNMLAALVINRYELGSEPTPASDLSATAYGSQPTFSWTHENSIGKLYPAFQLKVMDGSKVLYDSGALPAPARDAFGRYTFTAPIWPGMMTANGVVEADKTYTWKVTMLDAKFTEFPSSAAQGTFRILGSGALSDYGQIAVAVKYMGPGTVATSGVKNLIRVEAYASPDFSGTPYGVGYVRHTADENGDDSLAAADRIEMNALVTGLVKDKDTKGKDYYLRAFLDTNGNGEREDWESWGYVNYVGTESNDVYAARAVTVKNDAHVPTCVIYIEDADTNNNQLPDVWEWNKDGGLGGKSTKGLSATSPYVVTIGATGTAATNILWVVGQSGAAQLPYYAMLTQFENGGKVPAVSLALAMAGIDLSKLNTEPVVTITSFSLTDGITFDVDTRTTVDGQVLVPKAVKVKVTLTLQLQKTTSLSKGWTDVGDPVTDTFEISETTTVSSDTINAAIRKIVDEQKGEGFFRVDVTVGSELLK